MSRGKYEESHLTARQKAERAGLPAGIGIENSPLFDLPSAPWDLLPHLVRYYYVTHHLVANVTKAFAPPTQLNFLDVGCAMGEIRNMIYSYRFPAGYSKKYVGVDGDPIKLALARTYTPSGEFVEGILPQVLDQFDDSIFHGLVCTEVYEHLEASEGEELLDRMWEIAAPGAIAVFTVPCPGHTRYRENPLHLNEILPKDFIRTAEHVGWTVRDWFWLRMPNLPSMGDRIPREIQRLVNAPLQDNNLDFKGNNALYILRVG